MHLSDVLQYASNWQDAVRHNTVGMGSATECSYSAVMVAREKFVRALADCQPEEIAGALLNGRRAESRLRELDTLVNQAGIHIGFG